MHWSTVFESNLFLICFVCVCIRHCGYSAFAQKYHTKRKKKRKVENTFFPPYVHRLLDAAQCSIQISLRMRDDAPMSVFQQPNTMKRSMMHTLDMKCLLYSLQTPLLIESERESFVYKWILFNLKWDDKNDSLIKNFLLNLLN